MGVLGEAVVRVPRRGRPACPSGRSPAGRGRCSAGRRRRAVRSACATGTTTSARRATGRRAARRGRPRRGRRAAGRRPRGSAARTGSRAGPRRPRRACERPPRAYSDPMATDTAADAQLSVNTIRTLAIDAIEKAGSGHPGLPMAMAPLAYLLYAEVMDHDPKAPMWPDRDRFVLSAGHGSMLLYATLHLAGYDLGARRAQALPPVGVAHAGPPRARPHPRHAGRRGHHRAARPGLRQRGRHGASPSASCASTSAARSRTTASTRSSPTAT